jgi:hypothetical protein
MDTFYEDVHMHLGSKSLNIVTCRPIVKEQVDEHVSVEIDSWKQPIAV